MTETAALMAHVIAQTQANIQFLQEYGYLDPTHAANIQAQLAVASVSGRNANNGQTAAFSVPATRAMVVPPPAAQQTVQAKTLWAYNEDGSVSVGF